MGRVTRLRRGALRVPWFLRTEDEEQLAEITCEEAEELDEAEADARADLPEEER